MADLEPIKVTPFMSVIEGRKPKQKIHRRLGDAKNAFDTPKPNPNILDGRYNRVQNTHGWGNLYEHINGQWVLLWEVPQPTPVDTTVTRDNRIEYETRPWRMGDSYEEARDRVRAPASPQPEPGTELGDVAGSPEHPVQQGEPDDSERASGGWDGRCGRLRAVLIKELSTVTSAANVAEVGGQEMIRLRSRAAALEWVVKRLDEDGW